MSRTFGHRSTAVVDRRDLDNVAESFYGTASWDDHWSKLNGDGNMTWGRE